MSALITSLRPVNSGHELVRLGPDGDGGYLVPDDLDGISACFSPGVSFQSGFEAACAQLGMNVFLADGSVSGPAVQHARFDFTHAFISSRRAEGLVTMDDWIEQSLSDSDGDLLLQMDIEGAEYEALLSISTEALSRFRILVVEFHRLDQLWNPAVFPYLEAVFIRLCLTHDPVHIHPNNCCGVSERSDLAIPRVMEFTFLRRDRLRSTAEPLSFPHELDFDNTKNPPLTLPLCWQ